MRAGKLDKTVVIERRGETVDEFGTVSDGWTLIASVRAQIVQASTEEFLRSAGTSAETAIVFRIRHRADLMTSDRVTHAGRAFDVKEIKELGRREGLDLRCVAIGA